MSLDIPVTIENWNRDKSGFFTNGNIFFHISELKFVGKHGDKSIILTIGNLSITLSFQIQSDQQKMFDLFTEQMKYFYGLCIENSEVSNKIKLASLDIQNKLAGKFIHDKGM